MLVLNQDNKLFMGERAGVPGEWQFPQGGIEAEFSEEENVLKELYEELGVEKEHFEILKKLKATNAYDWEQIPEYAKGKWRGQKQSFWLVSFKGKDSDINLSRFEEELMNFRWCTPDEVRTLASPRRLKGYQAPLKELEAYLAL